MQKEISRFFLSLSSLLGSTMFVMLITLLTSCTSSQRKGRRNAEPTHAEARAAYDQHRYNDCARYYLALGANAKTAVVAAGKYYGAACCSALAGRPDAAFSLLIKAIKSGLPYLEYVSADKDFSSLHADGRWQGVVELLAREQSKQYTRPSLRDELLARQEVDKAVRLQFAADLSNQAIQKEVVAVDASNTDWLKQVVEKYGWPTKTMVGQDGAFAAYLLVQHADQDLDFQRACLVLMKVALRNGEADALTVAYVEDRIAVAEKRPQRYGTQFMDSETPFPIEDFANVDERRASVGLGTLADYKNEIKLLLHKQTPPAVLK